MDLEVGAIFKRLNANIKPHHRIIFLRGGARSGKSFLVMQLMTIWLYTGHLLGKYYPAGGFTVIRATFPALRATVLRDFVDYLFELGIYHHIDHRKTINEFHFKGRHIDFIPADNPQKLRGRKHFFAWLEEINDLPYDVFTQVNLRLTNLMFMTVNPSGEPWGKTEIEDKRIEAVGDVLLDVSTFKDNPFLEDSIVNEIKKLEFIDRDLFQIYNLGQWTKLKGLIYPDVYLVDRMPEGGHLEESYGLDFGYVNQASFVRVLRYKHRIFIQEIFYQEGLLIDELARRILEANPRRVICDSAEPRSIAELRKRGVNASPAKKGADSVRQGINFIKQHKIYVTSDSLGIIAEAKKYKWSEDLNGKLKEDPIKEFDHSWDAARYAINRSLRSKMRLL